MKPTLKPTLKPVGNKRLKLSALNHKDEHKYTVSQDDRKPFSAKYYLTDSERRELMNNTSSSALVLYEYYLRLACSSKTQPELSDLKAARDLGMKFNTVRGLKKQLKKAGWVKIIKTPRNRNTGHKGFLYYLGKEAVRMN